MDPVEPEGDPRELEVIVSRALRSERLRGPDPSLHDDVLRTGSSSSARCLSRRSLLQPDHEEVAHPPARVVVAIEAEDLVGGLVHVVGDLVKSVVVGRDEPSSFEVVSHEPLPRFPVGAAVDVEEHEGRGLGLAGLQEGEQLERLVLSAESSRAAPRSPVTPL